MVALSDYQCVTLLFGLIETPRNPLFWQSYNFPFQPTQQSVAGHVGLDFEETLGDESSYWSPDSSTGEPFLSPLLPTDAAQCSSPVSTPAIPPKSRSPRLSPMGSTAPALARLVPHPCLHLMSPKGNFASDHHTTGDVTVKSAVDWGWLVPMINVEHAHCPLKSMSEPSEYTENQPRVETQHESFSTSASSSFSLPSYSSSASLDADLHNTRLSSFSSFSSLAPSTAPTSVMSRKRPVARRSLGFFGTARSLDPQELRQQQQASTMSLASSSRPAPPRAESVIACDFPDRLDAVDGAKPPIIESAPLNSSSRKAASRLSSQLELLQCSQNVETKPKMEKKAKETSKRGRVVSWLLRSVREPRKGLRKMPSILQVLQEGAA
jgi:hypothetical protein